MQPIEFVEKFLKRWKPLDPEAFAEDCKEFLERYRGESLHYAFNRLVMEWPAKQGTPKLADILDVCNAVARDNAPRQATPQESRQSVNYEALAEQVMNSPQGQWMADRMMGRALRDFVEKHGRVPDKQEVAAMQKTHDGFLVDLEALRRKAPSDEPIETNERGPRRMRMSGAILRLGEAMLDEEYRHRAKYGSKREVA